MSDELAPTEREIVVVNPGAEQQEPESYAGEMGASEEGALTAKQRTALESLMSGRSAAETARTLGVARATMFRWLRNPVFQAEYNQWREQVEASGRARLLALVDKAVDAVENDLERGNGQLGMQLLKGMGIVKAQPPGLTNAEEVRNREMVDEVKRVMELERELGEVREGE
jgi:transposase-like protein